MKGKKIAEFHEWYVDNLEPPTDVWDTAAGLYRTRALARRRAAEYLPRSLAPDARPVIRRVTVQIYEHKRAK